MLKGKGKKKGKDDAAAEAEGAPAAEGEGAEGAEAGGKKKLPMLFIIIGAVAVLVLAGGGGAAFFLLKPKPPHGEQVADAHAKPEKKKKKKEGGHGEGGKPEEGMGKVSEGPEGVTYYTLPAMVSDMQGADGRPAQLKIGLTFELGDEETAEVLNENMPRLKDMLQTFLREMRPEDLQGSQGTFRLRQELIRRVNLIIQPATIKTINLTEMVMT